MFLGEDSFNMMGLKQIRDIYLYIGEYIIVPPRFFLSLASNSSGKFVLAWHGASKGQSGRSEESL